MKKFWDTTINRPLSRAIYIKLFSRVKCHRKSWGHRSMGQHPTFCNRLCVSQLGILNIIQKKQNFASLDTTGTAAPPAQPPMYRGLIGLLVFSSLYLGFCLLGWSCFFFLCLFSYDFTKLTCWSQIHDPPALESQVLWFQVCAALPCSL